MRFIALLTLTALLGGCAAYADAVYRGNFGPDAAYYHTHRVGDKTCTVTKNSTTCK